MSSQIPGKRLNEFDFYPTPLWCLENLKVDWGSFVTAHEPCKGSGQLLDYLEEQGLDCSYSELREGKDFFDWNGNVDLILTNPPFTLAQEFIEYSIAHADTVIMLLRINYLGSKARHDWWKANKPTALHVLSKRPSFTGVNTDSSEYAWYIWDKTEKTEKGIFWVDIPTKNQLKRDHEFCRKEVKSV